MKQVLFAGCSYTAASGFELGKDDPRAWVNLVHKNSWLAKYELNNVASGGRSNAGIFQDAVLHMSKGDTAVAFVAWTSVPRYAMHLGLETYDTSAIFVPNCELRDHNLHDIKYSKRYLHSIRDRFTSLAHPHYEILQLLDYVNALVNLARLAEIQLYFINALCPWDDGYFDRLSDVLPESYTEFTKQIIKTKTRDDAEVFEIYNNIHTQYEQAGGIQPRHWINLYGSFRQQLVDFNSDGRHPGTESNQLYYRQITQVLNATDSV